ncbi:BEL1-like homeodomain protein 8 isoform X2 [Ziziphus jujuba]|nr:BEL1-like homeodomain protein 8 isoform X2 [Ziziphus jujuba]
MAVSHDHHPHGFGSWRSFNNNNPQQSLDNWVVNYGTSGGNSVGSESGQNNPMFVRELNANINPLKSSCYSGYQDLQYHNTLEDVVTASASRNQAGIEISSLANELVLLPNFVNQSTGLRFDNAAAAVDHHQWSEGELGFNIGKKIDEEYRNVVTDSNPPQGLSLSLSSNPPSKLPATHFDGCGGGSEDLHSRSMKSGYLCSIPKPSIISKAGGGKSLQDIVGISSANAYRNTGPLGPFTGYATILKSSKFLKPAQQLLDEFCCITVGSKRFETGGDLSERISREVSVSASASASVDAMDAIETEIVGKGNNSCASSSTFYGSNEFSGDGTGVGSISSESFRPEYQQKKAKLLYMQEEVCRRYKQYHQQMQMVVSSFETVAGLSASTPYICLALKMVARHFRCLKNVITDQLKHIRKALGEDLSSPTTGTSSSKGEANTARLKYMEQSFQKHKSSGVGVGFAEPQQQHIWRPQRGLPERSVAILRAWLFEHFLHPYPTDTDKHMLATQTGLSRNQVSNWFINARVRVWKPMVEEIHMLETKGLAEVGQSPGKRDGNSATEGTSRQSNDQTSNRLVTNMMPKKQLECSSTLSSVGIMDCSSGEQVNNQEKRSRLECQDPTSVAGALAGFVPYQRSGLEVGGLGAVSLTLGLRHGVESAQQQHNHHQQQLRQQEDQLRRQLGGQMIHDFVG